MPTRIWLRNAMGMLWELGRGEAVEAERFLMHLSGLRSAAAYQK